MPETYAEKVDRILRDHEGYTGDGQGGHGELPVGDRSTARKAINKRDLRELMKTSDGAMNLTEANGYTDAVASELEDEINDIRDLAYDRANIFPTVETGLAATEIGQSFSVESVDPAVEFYVYRKTGADTGELIASTPSTTTLADKASNQALLNEVEERKASDAISLAAAGLPAQLAGDFHTSDRSPLLAFSDASGIALGVDSDGLLIERIGGEFHSSNDSDLEGFVFIDSTGRVVITGSAGTDPALNDRVDGLAADLSVQTGRVSSIEGTANTALALAESLNGAAATGVTVYSSVGQGLGATPDGGYFAVSDGGPDYQVLYQRVGSAAEERGSLQSLTSLGTSEAAAGEGRLWRRRGAAYVARTYSSKYTQTPSSFFTTHQDLYAHYDGLASTYPEYTSKDVIGHDGLGNEIREYTFYQPKYRTGGSYNWDDEIVRPPTIVITGSIHGHERNAPISLFTVADELCRNWRDDEYLSEIRWNCEVVIIPCVSPSGIDLSSRKNHNGVDLNRNFPYLWDEGQGSPDPDSNYYRGPAPASEMETQAMMAMESRHDDAFAFVDVHNSSSLSSQGFAAWFGTGNAQHLAPALDTLAHMEGWCRREISTIDEHDPEFTRISKLSQGSIAGWFSVVAQRRAYLAEAPQSGGLGTQLNQRRHAFEMLRVMLSNLHRQAVLTRLSQEV